GRAGGQELQHLYLPSGELRKRVPQALDDTGGQTGREDRVARRGTPDRVDDRLRSDLLEEVAGGTGLDGAEDLGIAVERREDQHRGRGAEGAECRGGGDAVEAVAEAEVAEHDIGVESPREDDRLLAGRGLADD